MSKFLVLFSLLILSVSAVAKRKIIYGMDGRKDVATVRSEIIQKLSKSVAARVNNFTFTTDENKKVTFRYTDTLSSPYMMNLCKDERFANQPAVADCSGFLVGKDLLATAGHCLTSSKTTPHGISGENHTECSSNSWVFDYKADKTGAVNLSNINPSNIYKCVSVVKAKLFGTEDYAIIKLDREVKGRTPLKIRSKKNVRSGQKLFVIGHPSGLPMKFASGAKVFEVRKDFFSTNLDTFGGNSGSPVFNKDTNEVEGILVRGDVDYIASSFEGKPCQRVNVCNSNRKKCLEDDPNILGEHVSNISKIKPYL